MEVVVSSYSMIRVDRYYEASLTELGLAAAKSIFENLKEKVEPDVVLIANSYSEKTANQVLLSSKITRALGFASPSFRVESGDSSGGASIYAAYKMIKSGSVKTVLIIGAEKLSDFPSSYLNEILLQNMEEEYESRVGILPQSYSALRMKIYMKKYGVDYDYFVNWPYLMHKYGSENPYAYLKFQVDKDAVKNSQLISEPLRLFDTAARADGAAAVLLASEDVAKKIGDSDVKVKDVSSSSGHLEMDGIPSLRGAFAKMGRPKFDYLEVHDSYSIQAALILEELGFTRGKSLEEIESVPVNFSGGLKSRGYPGGATGIYQLIEAAMQLSGEFPGRRAQGVEKALVVSTDDLGYSSFLTYLSR
ncbi:MAG: thiolase family protein [Candidatus Aramenus sp.]|nr:thiolase family protein [Candidatus Aramenus sp.]